jgi:hypothetical protein
VNEVRVTAAVDRVWGRVEKEKIRWRNESVVIDFVANLSCEVKKIQDSHGDDS